MAPIAPPPRAVPSSSGPGGYYDPRTSRRPSRYASPEEIGVLVAAFDAVTLRTVEGMASVAGCTVLDLVTRRVAFVPRCEWCRAPGGGDFGHGPRCRVAEQWREESRAWWLKRARRKAEANAQAESDEDEDGLPF